MNTESQLRSFHYSFTSLVFMTLGAAKGPSATTQTNPRHVLKVHAASSEGGAI